MDNRRPLWVPFILPGPSLGVVRLTKRLKSKIDQFFEPGKEILLARTSAHVLSALRDVSEAKRQALGENARKRVLSQHTAAHRAETLERYVLEAAAQRKKAARPPRLMPYASTSSGGQS